MVCMCVRVCIIVRMLYVFSVCMRVCIDVRMYCMYVCDGGRGYFPAQQFQFLSILKTMKNVICTKTYT